MKKVIAFIMTTASLFLLIAGCGKNVSSTYFPGNQGFKKMQDDSYINVFASKSDSHDGVTLRVEAIASDGLTTYVRIATDGNLPAGLVADDEESLGLRLVDEDFRQPTDETGEMVAFELPAEVSLGSNHIVDATLLNGSDKTWSFRKQTKRGRTGEQLGVLRPTLRDSSLKQNEEILIFYNTELADTTTFSLEVEVQGIPEKFIIEGLESKIAPIVARNYSGNNLFYEAAFADMQLLSAKSTYLETILTIQWIVKPGFSNTFPLYTEHALVFSWGDSSASTFMFFPDDTDLVDEPIEIISNHTLLDPLPLNEDITVSLQYTPNNENVGALFVMPKQ